MDINMLKAIIKDLESFYHRSENLPEEQKNELKAIIDRFKNLSDHSNLTEIIQIALLFIKLISEGGDFIKHIT